MMTWPEVKQALAQGKTTALIYNGGTEHRGPQNVNGGHNLMAHAIVVAIAEKLGNAIATPVLPFSPNDADPAFPGTIGITAPLFAAINEQVAEQMIKNGFKNIVLMGDHGGGLKELSDLANKLDQKYAQRGIRIIYCNEVFDANDKWLAAHHFPTGQHAGIPDTSLMLYLGGDKGWVRKDLLPTAVGVEKGIHGDARKSTPELGKSLFEMKVQAAADQIHRLLNK